MRHSFSALAILALAVAIPHAARAQAAPSLAGQGAPPPSAQTMARGKAIMQDLGWPSDMSPSLDSGFRDLTVEHVFAGLYGRSGLAPRDRELVVAAIIIAQGGTDGLIPHLAHAMPRLGFSDQNIRELIYTSCFYAGWPKCSSANHVYNNLLKAQPIKPPSIGNGAPSDVRMLTDKFYAAVNRGDAATVAGIVRPDAVIVHSIGLTQTGKIFSAAVATLGASFTNMRDVSNQLFDDVVIQTATIDVRFMRSSGASSKVFRITNTWHHGLDGWQIVHIQSTEITLPAPAK